MKEPKIEVESTYYVETKGNLKFKAKYDSEEDIYKFYYYNPSDAKWYQLTYETDDGDVVELTKDTNYAAKERLKYLAIGAQAGVNF